jgi:NADH:ubiquinone oxidoreductase subunit 2 (subunit N)
MPMHLTALLATLVLGVAVFSAAIASGDRRWWLPAGATAVLVVLAGAMGHGWAGVMLLNAAELAAVWLVAWRGTPAATSAARRYLLAVLPAIALTVVALVLTDLGNVRPAAPWDRLAVVLLIVGFALKLGLVPVYFWLPAVARSAPAMTTALIVAVLDVAVFGELLTLREHAAWVFTDFSAVWLALALASLLGGALLALAQRQLTAMLAFSSIDDMGYLLIGLVAGGDGLAGVGYGLVSHALCKLALFGAVGIAEWRIGEPVTLETRGLAARVPIASAAFMVGAFCFIGVPPGLGFLGHWRLYLAGAELGGPALLACMYVATALALLCYVRAIHRTWLGAPSAPQGAAGAPVGASAVVLLVAMGAVALGLVPGLLGGGEPATPLLSFLAGGTP